MEVTKGKISLRQGILLLILALGAPSLRVMPNYLALNSREAGWLAPVVAIVPGLFLVFVLNKLFSKTKCESLYDVYDRIFGRVINKFICIIYIAWIMVLTALYLRMYGERVIGEILFEANLPFVLLVMSIFVLFIVNDKIDAFGRLGEILVWVLISLFMAVFLFVLPQIKLENIYPVTYYDIVPILKGSIPILAISSYITLVMFIGDRISYKKELKKLGTQMMIFYSVLLILLFLVTVGLFGANLIEQFVFPYYSTLKNIRIMESIERLESLFISVWISSDFVIVTLFFIVMLTLIKRLFNMRCYKKVSPLAMIVIFFIALNLGNNIFEIENGIRAFSLPMNIALFWVMPIFAWIVGKVRRIV